MRESSGRGDEPREAAPLPTFGGTGVVPGVDLASNTAVREAMDDGTGVDERR